MKKYFFTGLAILLPVALTLLVVSFVFNLLTQPFLGFAQQILSPLNLDQHGSLANFISQILILLILFVGTVLLGIAARWVFLHYMIRCWESLIQKIPLVRTIYRSCKDVISHLFGTSTTAFKQVVMVPFPHHEAHSLGFVTRDDLPEFEDTLGTDRIVVFIPTTPNPTSGFLTIFKRQDVVFLDMKVEEAFKYILSCGVIVPAFRNPPEKG